MTQSHPALRHPESNLIGGAWLPIAGDQIRSTMPADPDRVVWSGTPTVDAVGQAVEAAAAAFPAWSAWPIERRIAVLRRYQQIAKDRAQEVAEIICDETGKVMWDCKAEAGLLAGKVEITLEDGPSSGRQRVSGYEVALNETRNGRCWFRPHGVMAVVGPFNFPAHLPNGHIVPALLMGNTIVFKPSDKAPAVGQMLAELFHEALEAEDAPAGVFNLIQGAADVAGPLVSDPRVDGVLFTGSWTVGRRILEANLDQPGKMIALEMGGNNAAVIMPDADLRQAVIECVRCAFITTGQRCTCTRRLIVHEAVADQVIEAVVQSAASLVVGDPRSDEPTFMGPIISSEARQAVLDAQARFAASGGEVLLESKADDSRPGWYLSPSVIRVPRFALGVNDAGCDDEVFGPLLRISVVASLDEAIEQTNATRFGLAASIFSRDAAAIERFTREARSGCVNVNTGTAGASSKLPFGGLGWSGNHRPAGAFSLDYCAVPVAGMIESGDAAGVPSGMTAPTM